MSQTYASLNSQIAANQNLSLYSRQQKEARIEHNKLTEEEQKEKLLEVYNNRPPVFEGEQQIIPKQITTTNGSARKKCPLGVINPIHQFNDPRIKKNENKQKEQEWYASRVQQKQQPRPNDPLVEPQPDLILQANKIELKPPPILEKEKPIMQDHLSNPYIYIKKVFKKNSMESNIKHPDIWDKSTHTESLRINKIMKQEGKKRPQSAKPIQQQNEKLNKQEREEFYLKNLRMKESLFNFFKTVNQLLKSRKFNKIIYKGELEQYDLNILFNLWAEHKKYNFKQNPEKYLTKEQFVDFMLVIGLDPDKKQEAERFFDFCYDDVVKGPGLIQGLGQDQNGQPQDSKWLRLFKE